MPELPEVENFRQLLLPFVGNDLLIERVGDHPRVKVDELLGATGMSIKKIEKLVCTDVLRRGKQICLVLLVEQKVQYLFLHMGMTGRIRVYGKSENWGEKKERENTAHAEVSLDDETSLPKFTCAIFSSLASNYTAYFCDPRKFGSAYVANDLSDLESLAPDALKCTDQTIIDNHILPALTNQRLGIKAILLDQKRAVSGVGNWVADEVLYQCKMHPDQTKLDESESMIIYKKLHEIVSIAVKALKDDNSYPENWLFHYRWTGKKSGKDAEGRSISFITSGGRTTAIINTMQKLYARSTPSKLSPKKKMQHDLLSPRDMSNLDSDQPQKRDSDATTKMTPKPKRKITNDINVAGDTMEVPTGLSSGKKRSNRQTDLKTDNMRKRSSTTELSKIKRQKITGNKVVKGQVILRRSSPRFNKEKSC